MKTLLTTLIVGSLVYVLWRLPQNKKQPCGCNQHFDDMDDKAIKKSVGKRIKVIQQLPMEYNNNLPYTMPGSILEGFDTRETNTANSNVPSANFALPRWR